MIERGQDRRQTVAWFSSIPSERRRKGYERRGRAPVIVQAGMVRPGFGEAVPREERRRMPASGME